MTIVEYELNLSEPTIPVYVTDGGYWMNPDGSEKMIGVGLEGSIPDSITTFTLAELQSRQRAIHVKYPMETTPRSREIMTDEEVNVAVKGWVDAR